VLVLLLVVADFAELECLISGRQVFGLAACERQEIVVLLDPLLGWGVGMVLDSAD
jgi:hypothetical protein